MHCSFFPTALLVFTCCSWAQHSPTPPLSAEDQAFLQSVNKPVIISVPGMDRVQVTRNLAYKAPGTQELRADVYRPANVAANRPVPVVIFIHGGVGPEFPVSPKDWGIYQSYGRLMAASGLVAVVFNHRAGFPKTELRLGAEDLRDVIRFVHSHAAEWNANADRICLVAFSGGGPLLSVAMRDDDRSVRCQIGMFPIVDIQNSKLHQDQMMTQELAEYSPVEQIARNPNAPPMLIARAGHDEIPDLLVGLDRFISIALKNDANITVMNNPAAPHGFDNKQDTARTRKILHEMLAFLNEHLATL